MAYVGRAFKETDMCSKSSTVAHVRSETPSLLQDD